MNRLLITGVDSVVGSNLALALSDRWEVLGLYSHEKVEFKDFETVYANPRNAAELPNLVGEFRPQWIIYCPALSAASWDEWPVDADEDGGQTACRLADLAGSLQARLMVLSTDAVFSGPRMFHAEASPPTAADAHAEQARRMESALSTTGALVVRTHAYGWSPVTARGGFAERAWHALTSSIAVPADGRRHATPILASDLAELLARAYELNLQGLYHISGAERTSPFRFVRELAAACGLQSLARSHSIVSEPPRDLWEGETSMNSRRARRALELPMPLLREGLGRFAQQADNGWRHRLQSGGQTPVLERAA